MGTSLMTLFSYILSAKKRENFKEPLLLADVEKEALPGILKQYATPAGWITHYSMGIAWATFFELLLKQRIIKSGLNSGFYLGIFSGLTAILIWKLVFKFHPNPPKINYTAFYKQLFFAHIVYSVKVAITNRNNKLIKIIS